MLILSIFTNLGALFVFKYFGFFADSLGVLLRGLGLATNPRSLDIILPVGISFYTFQTLSYTIDVYHRKMVPTKDFLAFFAFVSFFPQLVAGPIERAKNLLPQFEKERRFDYFKAVDGLRQLLWGLFKKVVIADNCAQYVNPVFANYSDYSGSTLLLAAFLFAFQIYGDFSGYSDIAIGVSRLFGFDLSRNFKFPYFSRDIAEFWRRWHISLSSWFRDYVYIPIGGSSGKKAIHIRNVFVVFLLSGMWHGANWTFVVWGALNALCFAPLVLLDRNRRNTGDIAVSGVVDATSNTIRILGTFISTMLLWVFFRSESVRDAFRYLGILFSSSIVTRPARVTAETAVTVVLVLGLVVVEWIQRHKAHGLAFGARRAGVHRRWAAYLLVLLAIISFPGQAGPFIYFQF